MKALLRRTILGAPVWMVLILFVTMTALAWALWLFLSGAGPDVSISVRDAPQDAVTMSIEECTCTGGVASITCTLAAPDVDLDIDDFDDDVTDCHVDILYTNNSPSILYYDQISAPSDTAFVFGQSSTDESIAVAGNLQVQYTITPGVLLDLQAYGGTTQTFAWDIQIDDVDGP